MEFDDRLTSSARLAIMTCLAPGEAWTFTELKKATGITDGNLCAQTRNLVAAGYIETRKVARGARSRTSFRITELGLESLILHVQKLQASLAAGPRVQRGRPQTTRKDDSQVWS